MKFPVALFILSVSVSLAQESAPSAPAAPTPGEMKLDVSRHQRLAEAAVIGQQWQQHVRAQTLEKGMALWGYHAFGKKSREEVLASLSAPAGGKLTRTDIIEDRCTIDPEGKATPHPGLYITLRFHSEYTNGPLRESLILHEPAGAKGLKIVALRRDPIPSGPQAIFDLAANLGQLTLLKLHAAPKSRWEPVFRESQALAAALQITLPAIPEAEGGDAEKFGEQLVNLILKDTPALLGKIAKPADASPSFDSALPASRAILNAYALMLLYSPGDETAAQLAVIAATEGEKAKFPRSCFRPLIEKVHKKAPLPEVHEAVLTLASDLSRLIGGADAAFVLTRAPSDILLAAFRNMARVPSYQVSARFTAADQRQSTMEAILAPGAIDLTLIGFDGAKQMRNASKKGFFLSTDGGKTWIREEKQETTEGLCRTLQSPVDPAATVLRGKNFFFAGVVEMESETLYHFASDDDDAAAGRPSSCEYWVLLSGKGPVIRQARQPMTFGSVQSSGLFRYTNIGKEVEEIPVPGQLLLPAQK
jgi:hypothetical protein